MGDPTDPPLFKILDRCLRCLILLTKENFRQKKLWPGIFFCKISFDLQKGKMILLCSRDSNAPIELLRSYYQVVVCPDHIRPHIARIHFLCQIQQGLRQCRQPTSLGLIILCFYSPRPTHVLMIWTSNSCVPVVQHGLYSRLFAKGCPNGTVRDGMGPNRTKCDQTLPNGTIPDHIRKILSVGRHVGFVLEYPLTFQGTKMYLFSKLVQAKVSLYLIAT